MELKICVGELLLLSVVFFIIFEEVLDNIGQLEETSSFLIWFFHDYGLAKLGISHLVLVGCLDSFKVLEVLLVDE